MIRLEKIEPLMKELAAIINTHRKTGADNEEIALALAVTALDSNTQDTVIATIVNLQGQSN